MSDVQPALLFMRELRNVIEHPKPQRCARILDFRLTPGGEIERPSIELSWPGHEGTSSLAALMSTLTENLSTIAEVLMAHFCNVNVRNQGSLEIFVTELPEEQRRHRTVRLGYACYLGRQLVRFG
jgi:hypothetical protein